MMLQLSIVRDVELTLDKLSWVPFYVVLSCLFVLPIPPTRAAPCPILSHWPSITEYQPILSYTDPVPPSTKQYCLILTQNHQVPTRNGLHWPSTTKYQPVPPFTDQAPSSTNQYRPLLTQHHQVPSSTALYWPSTIKYQPVLPYTESVLLTLSYPVL